MLFVPEADENIQITKWMVRVIEMAIYNSTQ